MKPNRERPSKRTHDRFPLRAGLVVASLALVVRGAYLVSMANHSFFEAPLVDGLAYRLAALDLVEGRGFSSTFFFQPFGYPLFLALIQVTSSPSLLAVRIVQSLLGAVTAVLVLSLGLRLHGRTAGLIAGVAVALAGPLIFFEAEPVAAGPAALLFTLLVSSFLGAGDDLAASPGRGLTLLGRIGPVRALLLGLLGGTAVLFRATLLAPFFGGCAWLVRRALRNRTATEDTASKGTARDDSKGASKNALKDATRGAALRTATLVILGFALPTLPVALITRAETGKFTFLPSGGGLNLYIGNNPESDATINARPGSPWSELTDRPKRDGVRGGMWERNRYFLGKVGDYLVERPLDFVGGLGRKILMLIGSRELPRNVDPYLFAEASPVLRALLFRIGPFGFPMGLILPFAVLGLVLGFRRMPGLPLVLIAVFGAGLVLYFVTSRYRTPLIPLLCVAAGIGAVEWFRAALTVRRGKGLTRFLAGAATLAVAVPAGTLPGPFPAERLDYGPELRCCLAEALNRTGHPEAAETRFREAIDLRHNYADAHAGLAALLAGRGRTAEAATAYERALEADPDLARAHGNLAALLTDLNRLDEARDHAERAIALRPHEEAFRFNLARIHAARGRSDEARALLEEALDLDPGLVPALLELARLDEGARRIDEAKKHLRAAVHAAPEDPEPVVLLGDLLNRDRKFEEAAAAYGRALALDPDNAVVHFNRAFALFNLGRKDDAVKHLEKAIAIDPGIRQGERGAAGD